MKKILLLTVLAIAVSCGEEKKELSYEDLTPDQIDSLIAPAPIGQRINEQFEEIKNINKRNYTMPELKLRDMNQAIYDLGQLNSDISDVELGATVQAKIDSLQRAAIEFDKTIDYSAPLPSSVSAPSSYKPSSSEVESLFSKWDGSLPELKEYVKENMHDPSSFEHVETGWKVLNDGLHVRMRYRGNNAFGNPVVNSIEVKTDFEGKITGIISEN